MTQKKLGEEKVGKEHTLVSSESRTMIISLGV